MHSVWDIVVQCGMSAAMVIEPKAAVQAQPRLGRHLIIASIHILIRHGPPQSFNHNTINCSAFAIRADCNAVSRRATIEPKSIFIKIVVRLLAVDRGYDKRFRHRVDKSRPPGAPERFSMPEHATCRHACVKWTPPWRTYITFTLMLSLYIHNRLYGQYLHNSNIA